MTGTDNTNPGNFANRPKEEVRDIAAKGGHASHGGGTTAGSTSGAGDVSGSRVLLGSLQLSTNHELGR
jgi:hypothetical protein